MSTFYILVGASAMGIVAVFWLLKNDREASGEPPRNLDLGENKIPMPSETDVPGGHPGRSDAGAEVSLAAKKPGLLQRFGIGKKSKKGKDATAVPGDEPLPFLKEPMTGSASITVGRNDAASLPSPSGEGLTSRFAGPSIFDKEKIDKEIELTSQLNELKQKYETLDKLLKEKSSLLERNEEALQNELKNRKDFNKVKDILEKELKETKERARGLQVELTDAMAASEGHKKRITQIEEKTTKLQKTILEKDDEINNLLKRLQTFASPSTAATPISINVELPAQAPQQAPQPPAASDPETAPAENREDKENDKDTTETVNHKE